MNNDWKQYLYDDERAWVGKDKAIDILLQRLSRERWSHEYVTQRWQVLDRKERRENPEPEWEPTEEEIAQVKAALADYEERGGKVCDEEGHIWGEPEPSRIFRWPSRVCERCGTSMSNYDTPLPEWPGVDLQ